MKKIGYIFTILFLILSSLSSITASAMSVHHQHGYAVKNVNLNNFKTVNNVNHTKQPYDYKYVKNYSKNPFEKKANEISGNNGVKFKTMLFLPGGAGHVQHYNNPQAVVVTPDAHFAFVAYNNSVRGKIGWVCRFDLKQLRALGVDKDKKKMDLLRRVFSKHHHHHPMTKDERLVRNAVKIGPKFKMGHGQSLSYNPKNKQIWILGIGPGAQNHANAQQISFKKLNPMHKVTFKFSKQGYGMNDVLTFDKNGNAYTYACTFNKNSKLKKGTIKIYKGRITQHSAHFKLIRQGIRHAPGYITQSMAYSPKTNRLYFVSDASILSVPANKVGHLKKTDVHWQGFKTRREFEGLSFDNTGRSYLLVNRGVELLSTNKIW